MTRTGWLTLGAILLGLATPAKTAEPRLYPAADIRADLSELYSRLQRAHFNLYERRSKAAYDGFYLAMLGDIRQPETQDDIAIRFQKFTAYGRVAHARIDAAAAKYSKYRSDGGLIFPLTVRIVNGRAFVAQNCSGLARPASGSEMLALDGVRFRRLRHRLAAHVSADTDYMMDSLLEYYFPRLLWQETGSRPRFELRVKWGDRTQTIVVPARTQASIERACATSDRLQLDPSARIARVLDGGIAYLRPGPFYNDVPGAADMYDNRAFVGFIASAFAQFRTAGARTLLIDLRDNPGGDSSFSDVMIARFANRPFAFASSFRIRLSPETIASNEQRLSQSSLPDGGVSAKLARVYAGHRPGEIVDFPIPTTAPEPVDRFRGPVFLLINRASDSNTVFVAATVQDNRFGRLLGEESSDLASTLGAMEQFTLTRTGIRVGYPKAQIIRPSGDRTARGVVPDVRIRTPVVEGRDDPVLERALAHIRQALHARQ